MKAQTAELTARLEKAGKVRRVLRVSADDQKVGTAEEITKQLEAILEEQEREEKGAIARVASLRDAQFKQTQRVQALRVQEQALQADIQGESSWWACDDEQDGLACTSVQLCHFC